ncbi:glycosyltransferase family A protein [uncultured Methanolobus sp.]|uniref:glycosyltransferase family 2 protein n=1 Tax=uncultured Methanolobus sp. TaxID=218300 RepID=UPI0029C7CCDD|nr:glycosyltransferase family A protein [uncultured Methanolobus sp.]
MSNTNYILITPCKNEENHLLDLFNSLSAQTVRPLLWVIVDDGSTDSTPEMISQILSKNQWVLSLRLESKKRDIGKHVYYVYNSGFNFSMEYCRNNGMNYEYIGNIDADMVLNEDDYFQRMIDTFETNPKIGIMSSKVYSRSKNKLIEENDKGNLPMGSPRLWRKNCFNETDGYPLSYSADSVSNIIAKKKGWDLLTLDTIGATQARRTSSAGGLWKGYIIHGKSAYYRNYSFLFVVLKSFKLCFNNPYYIGIAYFYGFLLSTLCKDEKLQNQEILNYYHNEKFKETLSIYMKIYNQKINRFPDMLHKKKENH